MKYKEKERCVKEAGDVDVETAVFVLMEGNLLLVSKQTDFQPRQ